MPIPSEEDLRGVCQLHIETDPPGHTDYRSIVEPFFRRALKQEVARQVQQLMQASVADALRRDRIEIVREFARVIMPLTHIGRVCPADTDVHGTPIRGGERVSLCWASANFDEQAFDSPEDVKLDCKPDPHLAFGAGTHFCLGAHHARLVMRTLITALCDHVGGIE